MEPTTPDGAPGIVIGVTAADGAEEAPVPTELVAATSNSYVVPLVRPVATQVVVVHVDGDVVTEAKLE
jgi:hypothetical protein